MSVHTAFRWMLAALAAVVLSAAAFAQVGIAVTIAPPPLPVYEQPVCPGDGYIWTPGYWAYDQDYDDYYWVPGTWVMAPEVGYFWTPPYWGWNGAAFAFYDGYWGPEVGFYGGVDYGFGYFGTGFVGGRWDNGHFFYNRAVMNVNETNIHNVYVQNVTNVTVNHVSYNGGNGGITARPTPQQETYARARHVPPVQAQQQQIQAARGNRELRASVNQGKPAIAATAKPGEFKGNVVAAREAGGTYHPPANGVRPATAGAANSRPNASNERPAENNAHPAAENNGRPAAKNTARPAENNARPATNNAARPAVNSNARQAVHPNDLPAAERPPAPNTGNSKLDQKYQKQQDKMVAQQQKQRQKLQQQQDKEHAQQQKQQVNEAKQQQLEQRHQQQTSQLQQRQAQQTQRMQQKQQPAMHAQAAPAAPERKPPHQ